MLKKDKNLDFEKDMVKLPFANLMLEVTRKCNLRCEHCMRGEPQNMDMSDEILGKVFGQTKQIFHLSLTGGEPFLAPHVIEKMVDVIIENKIRVGRCTTVDNGTILNDIGIRCVKALNRLADYIYDFVWDDKVRNDPDESMPVSISISNSIYHKNDVQKAIDFYKSYASPHVMVNDQGEWETGMKDRNGKLLKNKDIKSMNWVKKEGRAKENNLKNAKYMTGSYLVELLMDDGDTICVDTGIQVCANGNVVLSEPLSFETMDKVNMGNVLKEPISCMIYKWNWMEPLKYQEVVKYCNNMTTLENPNLSDQKRKELVSENAYLDLKKILYVQGHKDYPYLSHEDLATCATAALAIVLCRIFENEPDISEEEIIEMVVRNELTGEYTSKLTKRDLNRAIDNLVAKNNEKAMREMGIVEYFKYLLALKVKSKKYYDNLEISVYEK